MGSFTGVSSFDWRNVVAGGITGAITGGMYAQWGSIGQALEKTRYVKAGLLAAGGSAATYVGQKGAGLDVSFSWRGIAANALGTLVSAQISKSIGLPPGKDFGGSGNFGADLLSGVIGGVVSVHTRRALGFDDKIDYGMIALDAFGNAVGNAMGGAIGRGFNTMSARAAAQARNESSSSSATRTYALSDNDAVQSTPYAEWRGPPFDANNDGVHDQWDEATYRRAIAPTAQRFAEIHAVARQFRERDPNEIRTVTESDSITDLERITVTAERNDGDDIRPMHIRSLGHDVARFVRTVALSNIEGGKMSAGVVVGTPIALAKGVLGGLNMAESGKREAIYRLSYGHFYQSEHEQFMQMRDDLGQFVAHPITGTQSAIGNWYDSAISDYNQGNYFSYGMKSADASASIVGTLEGGVVLGRIKFGDIGKARKAGGTVFDAPLRWPPRE